MRGSDLLDKMELVNPVFIEAADKRPVRKRVGYFKWGAMAACLCLVVSVAVSVMAASVPEFYNALYAISPATAQFFRPVQLSCENNGIGMEVEGVYIHENTAEIYISMQDLEGNRIDGTVDLFDSYSIHTSFGSSGHCEFAGYDSATQTATFLITIEQWDDRAIEGEKLTFSVREFLSDKKVFEGLVDEVNFSTIELVSETQEVSPRGFGGLYFADDHKSETMTALQTSDPIASPTDGVVVTGVGFVDGVFHVQVYYSDILNTDNHGFISLVDKENEKIIPCDGSFSFFDASRKGSYEDYIFTGIDVQQLEEYDLYGEFVTSAGSVKGNWSVTFPLENTVGADGGHIVQ